MIRNLLSAAASGLLVFVYLLIWGATSSARTSCLRYRRCRRGGGGLFWPA